MAGLIKRIAVLVPLVAALSDAGLHVQHHEASFDAVESSFLGMDQQCKKKSLIDKALQADIFKKYPETVKALKELWNKVKKGKGDKKAGEKFVTDSIDQAGNQLKDAEAKKLITDQNRAQWDKDTAQKIRNWTP